MLEHANCVFDWRYRCGGGRRRRHRRWCRGLDLCGVRHGWLKGLGYKGRIRFDSCIKKYRALNFAHSKSTGVDVGAGVGGGTVHSSTPVGLLHPSSQTQVYAAAP